MATTYRGILDYLISTICTFLIAISFNWFFIPHQTLSSGVGGIALLINFITHLNVGMLNLLLNVPLLIIGYIKLGRNLMLITIYNVVLLSIWLAIVPLRQFTDNAMLDVIFGGVICGVGMGLILKNSGTTGGMDIVAILLSRTGNISIGTLLTILNGMIVVTSGFFFNWDVALYTLLGIFVTGKTIDNIYTNHIKITVNIVTEKGEAIREKLLETLYRGVTMIDAKGVYTMNDKELLMIVMTRYELKEVVEICKAIDPDVFINVHNTEEVYGQFAQNH